MSQLRDDIQSYQYLCSETPTALGSENLLTDLLIVMFMFCTTLRRHRYDIGEKFQMGF